MPVPLAPHSPVPVEAASHGFASRSREVGGESPEIALATRRGPRLESIWICLSASAAFFLAGVVAWIIGFVFLNGFRGLSPGFIFGGVSGGLFNVQSAGVFPMVFGTCALVLVMTVFAVPAGVATAVYLGEYADPASRTARVIRLAVNNLAGVPSIVFGLFGAGFFVHFLGRGLDTALGHTEPVWNKPGLLWAALTMAVLTLPVVVVATEEALRSVPRSIRDAGYSLGATRFQTLLTLVLPQALPGILTGGMLAVSRGAGEVAPILFVGAAYSAPLPRGLSDQFMELGYHVYVLATQSPDVDATRPLLFATVVVLLLLTFGLNIAAMLARFFLRRRYRASVV